MNTEFLSTAVAPLVYIASTMLFVFGLKGMTKVKSARRGNHLAAAGMFLAVVGALLELGLVDYRWIAIGLIVGAVVGAFLAIRVQMTEMPEMVALLNGFGGAASALVALSVVWNDVVEKDAAETMAHTLRGGAADAVTIALSILIGSITLTGSVVAMLKLKGKL